MDNLNKQVYGLGRYSNRLLNAVEHALNESPLEFPSEREVVVNSMQVCQKALAKLKHFIIETGFQSMAEEAFFFRKIKPLFYSKYIYYSQINNFLLNRPPGGTRQVQEFVEAELADLRRFFDLNHGFYQYYRSGATELDQVYFIRQKNMSKMGPFHDHIGDQMFSTPMDYTLSKLLANEKYQDYLNFQLYCIAQGAEEGTAPYGQPKFRWTGSQTELVELLYALVSAGVLNNGTAEIKSVAAFFQGIFGIELRSFYQKFGSIVNRKKDQTAFLDNLKASLLSRINEKLAEDPVELKRIEFKDPSVGYPAKKQTQPNNKPEINPKPRKKPRK